MPQYQLFFQQSSTAAVIVALDAPRWTVADVNEAYLAVTGETREQVMGQGLFEVFPESLETTAEHGAAHISGSFHRALATLDRVVLPVQRYDIRDPRDPGGFVERHWELSSRPIFDADGAPILVLHEVADVTARVLADRERERLLAALEARSEDAERARRQLSSIVESITDGFVAIDADFRYTYVNGRAAEMWGRPASQIVGRTPAELWGQVLDDSPFVSAIRQTLRDGAVRTVEDHGALMRRWMEMRVYPAADGVVCFFQDVTERRRAQESSAFLAEASRVLASSSDYTVTLRNLCHAAVPYLGDWCAVDLRTDPDATGWPPQLERVAAVHQDEVQRALGDALMREFPTDWSGEGGLPQVMRTGEAVFYPDLPAELVAASAVNDRHRELLAALSFRSVMILPLVIRDRVAGVLTLCMTDSGRQYAASDFALAQDLASRASVALDNARLLRDAAAANSVKTEFLRTISHELRQPLNATNAFLQLWELGLRGPLSREQQDDLVRIQRNQAHLMALIEDLLSFTRLEAGRLEVDRVRVPVADVMHAVDAMVGPQMAQKGVRYQCDECDPRCAALGDHDRIVQICLNLLTNALRATAAGGSVRLGCEADGEWVAITVSDTGTGVPADRLEEVFSPFTQLGRPLNQPKDGVGLGLAISRGLAEAMGGTLTATSTLGEGSVFTLRLPRSE